MMKDFYSPEFARYYDLVLYGKKSHSADAEEMEFIHYAFNEYAGLKLSNILDIGCGTGRFCVPMAKAGYTMTGIDKSEGMLSVCAEKLEAAGAHADLVKLSLEEFGSTGLFEGVMCMDSVICYSQDPSKIYNNLRKLNGCLCRDGVAIIETWNLKSHPELLNKEYDFESSDSGMQAKIREKNEYDAKRNIFTINLKAEITEAGIKYEGGHEEKLYIPDFSFMRSMLGKAGFKNIQAYAGFDFREETEEGDCMLYLAAKG